MFGLGLYGLVAFDLAALLNFVCFPGGQKDLCSQNLIEIGPKMVEIHPFLVSCLGLYLVTLQGHRAFLHKVTQTRFLAFAYRFISKELRGVPSVSSY